MIDLRTDVLVKEDVIARFQQNDAQIRDLLNENELILAKLKEPHILMTREEVATKLRCEPTKIPRAIPRCRIGKNWLFDKVEVENFILKKTRKY